MPFTRTSERFASRRTTFRLKVTGAALVTTLAALLFANLTFAGRYWRAERAELVETRTSMAQMVAAFAADAIVFEDKAAAYDVLRHALDSQGVSSVQAFDSTGRVFTHAGGGPVVQATRADTPRWAFHDDTLQVHAPIRLDQQRVGELAVVTDLDSYHQSFVSYALFAVLLSGLLAASAAAIAWTLSERVTEPLARLKSAMTRVRESGELRAAVEETSYVELADLVDEFNALLIQLSARDRDLHGAMDQLVTARDKAEQANRLKTEFLANISHEIRTPLNGVLGVAHLMTFDQLIPAQRERLQMIQHSGEDLLSIISNVLDVARLEAGEVELEHVDFQLTDVLARATEEAKASAAAKGVAFQLRLSPALSGRFVGDPARLQQVVRNLACNAIKFTEQGRVEVEAWRDGDDFVCSFHDTGVGVGADVLPRLFEKFEQADNSTTRRFGGLGLGLVICRELMNLFGGSIQVESQEGEGSRFQIRMPLPSAPALEPRLAAA